MDTNLVVCNVRASIVAGGAEAQIQTSLPPLPQAPKTESTSSQNWIHELPNLTRSSTSSKNWPDSSQNWAWSDQNLWSTASQLSRAKVTANSQRRKMHTSPVVFFWRRKQARKSSEDAQAAGYTRFEKVWAKKFGSKSFSKILPRPKIEKIIGVLSLQLFT